MTNLSNYFLDLLLLNSIAMKLMKFLFCVYIIVNSYSVRADSPLTSTAFYKAYETLGIIKSTPSMGAINEEMMRFLINPSAPIDVKLALINKLGWDISGKNNAQIFLQFLQKNKGYESENEFIENSNGYDLICYAYLTAMDDYFNVKDALIIATKASEKESKSFSVRFIAQLIHSQILIETSNKWCGIYQDIEKVKNDKALTRDMKPSAIKMVFKYIKGYKKYC